LAVASYALRSRGIELDVLLLDGGGHSETASTIAAEFGLKLTCIPGPNSGPGEAFLEGLRLVVESAADLVVTLDANGRHDPTQIPGLIDHLIRSRSHVVIGSRWTSGSGTPGLSLPRWFLGRAANVLFRLVTSSPKIRDATTSFRVARTEIIPALALAETRPDTYSVHTTFVANAIARGYRVREAPILYREAIGGGGGGLGLGDIGEFTAHLWALRAQTRRVRRDRLSPERRRFDVDHFGAEDDLECLAASKNFFEWVLDEFRPYLRGRVVEVGAGTGTITRKLVERYPDVFVVALEPADNMFATLDAYATLTDRVSAHKQTLADRGVGGGSVDVVLYVNVLEHVADDAAELKLAAHALRPGGALLVFGPALEALYSDLDHKAGHYRRYSLAYLRRIVEGADLRVVSLRYFDLLGVVPYLFVYRWLHRTEISSSTIWGYDRLIVPLSRLVQRVVTDLPAGKNVILVAVKDPRTSPTGVTPGADRGRNR
jgi:SAM-dependent methyltransferase